MVSPLQEMTRDCLKLRIFIRRQHKGRYGTLVWHNEVGNISLHNAGTAIVTQQVIVEGELASLEVGSQVVFTTLNSQVAFPSSACLLVLFSRCITCRMQREGPHVHLCFLSFPLVTHLHGSVLVQESALPPSGNDSVKWPQPIPLCYQVVCPKPV